MTPPPPLLEYTQRQECFWDEMRYKGPVLLTLRPSVSQSFILRGPLDVNITTIHLVSSLIQLLQQQEQQ